MLSAANAPALEAQAGIQLQFVGLHLQLAQQMQAEWARAARIVVACVLAGQPETPLHDALGAQPGDRRGNNGS